MCKGLQWLGAEACSDVVLNSVTQILEETLKGKFFWSIHLQQTFHSLDILAGEEIKPTLIQKL